jgi:phosphate-selective porin OprO/OprP
MAWTDRGRRIEPLPRWSTTGSPGNPKQGEPLMRNWFSRIAVATLLAAMTLTAVGAAAAELEAKSEDGILVFESDDSAFKWWVDARVYIDAAAYFDDGDLYWNEDEFDDAGDWEDYEDEFGDFMVHDALGGGMLLRRARFALKSQLWHHWYGEIDLDFAEEAVAVKDAYISYRGLFNGNGRVRVGNFRQPFGLEEVTTSRNLMFMERSQGTEPFVVGRRMGLEVTRWDTNWRASVSAFGDDVEDYVKYTNEQVNFAGRVNFTPINNADGVLLLGLSGTMQKPNFDGGDYSVKVNSRPETNVSDTKFVYSKYKDVDKYNVFGAEFAYTNKRLMLQGEYMMAKYKFLDPDSDPDVSNSGGYIFASYFLTNDSRKYDYKDAEFGRVVPSSKSGAWEVAARFSTVDLNDEDGDDLIADGGKSDSITLGVNYYPNANVKLMLNYGIVNNDENADGRGDYRGDYDFNYLSMRFQTAF